MYTIDHLRQTEFPHAATLTYLNHAGIAPLPQRAKRAIQAAVEALSIDPNDYFGHVGLPLLMELQAGLARFVNAADPAEIAFVTSTSAALNAIAQAIPWQPGDRVLFCDVEFPSNAYPWMGLQRDGVESCIVPADNGGLTLAAVEQHADERTRVIAASAVQFFTGHRTDLAAIGQFCRQRGILFVVDAIQAIGHMPFDVRAMNIDVLATGGQKSLLGLPGVGFIFVRDEAAQAMRPRLIHSNATTDYLHWLAYDLTPLPGAARFNAGTPNVAGIIGLGPSLALLQELDVANIDAHTTALSRYACERLSAAGLRVITPSDALGPIVTFRSPVDAAATETIVQRLAAERVIVVKHLDAAGAAYIRLSTHCYNVREDIDRFVEAYQRLSAASG
ncbi:MAG TPA: aminotransferase class V-fold PLP-dependent enzyme [Promineifilum sp.]|nr:aminotransferase class V-fold PLP-dependent enzyme [Promineifilum sp.]